MPALPRRVLTLLALALALRLGYAVHAHRSGSIPTSSDQYETIALNLLAGSGYSIVPGVPTAQREPSYPLFLAALYAPFGRVPALVLAVQCLLGTAACLLAWSAARPLFGERPALWALIAAALYPQGVYYSGYFFRDTLLAFLFMLLCWSSTRWSAAGEEGERGALYGGWAAVGLGLGNSAHLPALALAGLLLLLAAPARARLRRAVLYGAPLALAFGLWSARNAAVFGRFVAGSTHGGEEFYQALIVPPEDLGTSRQTEILAADAVFQETLGLPEAERNARLTRESLRWIAGHPGLYASRAAAGFVKFWKLWPYKRSYNHSYGAIFAASLLSDAWLIPLGLFGLWSLRRRWREFPALWAGVAGLTFVYGAVHAVIRYRLPLMLPLIVLAAGAAAELARGRKGTMPAHG
jgi:4-amino-4-deoxy-L-arabinose transferase-like glycosyltransferase